MHALCAVSNKGIDVAMVKLIVVIHFSGLLIMLRLYKIQCRKWKKCYCTTVGYIQTQYSVCHGIKVMIKWLKTLQRNICVAGKQLMHYFTSILHKIAYLFFFNQWKKIIRQNYFTDIFKIVHIFLIWQTSVHLYQDIFSHAATHIVWSYKARLRLPFDL